MVEWRWVYLSITCIFFTCLAFPALIFPSLRLCIPPPVPAFAIQLVLESNANSALNFHLSTFASGMGTEHSIIHFLESRSWLISLFPSRFSYTVPSHPLYPSIVKRKSPIHPSCRPIVDVDSPFQFVSTRILLCGLP